MPNTQSEVNGLGKYIVLYHAPVSFGEAMKDATPEDMQKGMEPWMAWFARCGDSLVDMGGPLVNAQKLTSAGNSPSDTSIIGYSILETESMEAAQALLEGHPHIQMMPGCEVELHEVHRPG